MVKFKVRRYTQISNCLSFVKSIFLSFIAIYVPILFAILESDIYQRGK